MAFVYWIKHKELHKDFMSEGYIGVTSKTVQHRFTSHILLSKNTDVPSRRPQVVHRAINKYGLENIEVVTLLESSVAYCYDIENKLRPSPNIGWNVRIGGDTPPTLGRPQTDHQKSVVSKMSSGSFMDKDHQKVLLQKLSNRDVPEEERKRRSISADKHPLDTPNTNIDILSRINDLYECYLLGMKQLRSSKHCGIPYRGMKSMFKSFDEGYNPYEDDRIQDFIKSYEDVNGIYVTGKETQEIKITPSNIHVTKKGNVVAYFGHHGVRKSKTFNVTRLGSENAMKMALLWLEDNLPQ